MSLTFSCFDPNPLFHFTLRTNIWIHLIFCVDELQRWSLNRCTGTAPLYCTLSEGRLCCIRWRDCIYIFPHNTHTHWEPCLGIGSANRALHRSASPDSSLKCPWQPPNLLAPVPALLLHLFLSGRASDRCCRISPASLPWNAPITTGLCNAWHNLYISH